MIRRKCEYALYKGEELLGIGTAEELAEQLGVAPKTIHFYASPAYHKRTTERARRLVLLGIADEI